ncbi:hypothetical protein [Siminovitchia fordii]|uniref:Uncharacterized protein n=1 Tax=Siminovitchia fordii TaxID=254759 RepID=A0ABQ4K9Y3_9BACI|nr:hypothetical protein [Siminovitchia fordii]GIN22529.1 hypothetical protein J1TS3_36630 [Siminovitchia fordii]
MTKAKIMIENSRGGIDLVRESNEQLTVDQALEKAIRDTYIPRQDIAPKEIGSGLWWDTSVEESARPMRYDEATSQWVPVGCSKEELDQISRLIKACRKTGHQ